MDKSQVDCNLRKQLSVSLIAGSAPFPMQLNTLVSPLALPERELGATRSLGYSKGDC